MPSLSRLPARSLFPAQSSSGLPTDVSPLPPHRMNNELVKTARADRSSVKPFQFIPIPFRPRIGCRMMCSLAACPLRHVPPSSCLLACRFLIRSAHPPCSSASLIRLALLALPVSRVGGAGRPSSRSHLVLISSCVPPTASACLLAALHSAHHRGAIADVIASFMRSAATVPPPPPRLACAGECLSRRVCAILYAVAMGPSD